MKRLNIDRAEKGQSIVEVIISVSILVIIASTAVSAILGSFSSSRLAKEETNAAIIASEGLEAVESIRNQSWDNLVNGAHGLAKTSGNWAFSGASDTDLSGRFTRNIFISDVDANTKEIISTVNWNFTPTRNNSVDMTLYLTNWNLSKASQTIPEGVTTCSQYCATVGYASGTCRQNIVQCGQNGEVNASAGDTLCTGGPSADACCCI